MKDEAFEYQGQRISFSDGYSDVNNNPIEEFPRLPVLEVKICNLCVVQLESAYVFKRLCREANIILRRKYSLQDEASASDHIKAEQEEEETTEGGADTLSCFTEISTDRPNSPTSNHIKAEQMEEEITEGAADTLSCFNEISTDSRTNSPTNVLEIKQKKHECKLCLKIYKTQSGLFDHNQNKHLNRKFPCDLCDKIFNSCPSLFYHKKIVHLKIRHKCGKCSKIFTTATEHTRHNESVHLDRQYICDICSTVYKSHFSITRHIKNKHLNAIRYHTCKICNKRYIDITALWSHSFQHRGFKPFKCTACDYTSVYKLRFKQHLRKRHQIIYNEQINGYKMETFSEALKFVLLEDKK
jgi:hypothetical protein